MWTLEDVQPGNHVQDTEDRNCRTRATSRVSYETCALWMRLGEKLCMGWDRAAVGRTEGPLVVAYLLTELVAPFRTARGVGNPVSLIAGASSVSRAGQGWALEGDQNCKSIHTSAHQREAQATAKPQRASTHSCSLAKRIQPDPTVEPYIHTGTHTIMLLYASSASSLMKLELGKPRSGVEAVQAQPLRKDPPLPCTCPCPYWYPLPAATGPRHTYTTSSPAREYPCACPSPCCLPQQLIPPGDHPATHSFPAPSPYRTPCPCHYRPLRVCTVLYTISRTLSPDPSLSVEVTRRTSSLCGARLHGPPSPPPPPCCSPAPAPAPPAAAAAAAPAGRIWKMSVPSPAMGSPHLMDRTRAPSDRTAADALCLPAGEGLEGVCAGKKAIRPTRGCF